MIRWSEGRVHLLMRAALRDAGFSLIAGEYPGGSDHELYPLNIVDPRVARDRSPDPRRHSLGEIIPDIVAIRKRDLVLGEAKVHYNEGDRVKLSDLIAQRPLHLKAALEKFCHERGIENVLPFSTLQIRPVLIFTAQRRCPVPVGGFSHIKFDANGNATFEGYLATGR